ncbi:rRNA-processing protein utp21 [Tieghemiomyces parasiticus]|uniref:rRNA-processing protein utp21 n=1 Tax=Tieghemiomyces parasiticus TaxID=78921 RepID=A0A9W8AGB6_9FUNG|nr:rRNA-processing protein utp21 [Tieghemiomyces parasiticus]
MSPALNSESTMTAPVPSNSAKRARASVAPTASSVGRLFQPYQTIGILANAVPVLVFTRSNDLFIMGCIGNSFQSYRFANMATVIVGAPVNYPITGLAGTDLHTLATAGPHVIKFHTGREVGRTVADSTDHLFGLLTFGEQVYALTQGGALKIWYEKTLEPYTTIEFDTARFHPTCIVHPATYLNKILIGSRQGTLQIWNTKFRKLVYEISSFGAGVVCIEQAPAVDVVAVGLTDGSIILHNIRLDERVARYQQNDQVTCITFSTAKDVYHMATGDVHGNVTVWDLSAKRLFHHMDGVHRGAITTLNYMPNSNLLLSAGSDNAMRQWIFDKPDGTCRRLREASGHAEPPVHVAFFGEGSNRIFTAGPDRKVCQLEVDRALSVVTLSQKARRINAGRFGTQADGSPLAPPVVQLAVSSIRALDWANMVTSHEGETSARIWSTDKRQLEPILLKPPSGSAANRGRAHAVAISHCGSYALVGRSRGSITLYTMQSGQMLHTFQLHTDLVTGLVCDDKNRQFVSGSLDGQLAFWNLSTRKLNHVIQCDTGIASLAYHAGNGLVVAFGDDSTIRVYDSATYKLVRHISTGGLRIIHGAVSPDGRWVVAALLDSSIRTWDLPTGHLIDWFRTDLLPTSLAFSPLGDYLATTHTEHQGVSLWLNKSMFRFIPMRPVTEAEPPTIGIPTAIRRSDADDSEEAADALTADLARLDASAGNDEDDELIIMDYETPTQLEDVLLTLSTVAKAKWQTLLHLDTIKKRNRPQAPPKKPESAPFFLQTLPGLQPKFSLPDKTASAKPAPTDLSAGEAAPPVDGDNNDAKPLDADSRVISVGGLQLEREFTRILRQCEADAREKCLLTDRDDDEDEDDSVDLNGLVRRDPMITRPADLTSPAVAQTYAPFITYMKSLNPSAVDLELRSMSIEHAFREPVRFLAALVATLYSRRDFELVQVYLHVFLKIYGDIVSSNPDTFMPWLDTLETLLRSEWQRVEDLLRYSQCLIEFTRTSRR